MTPSKEKALQALLTEKDKKAAAAAAGITYRTMMNYLNDPEFMRAYNATFGLVIADATRQAQYSMKQALNTLCEIAENKNETGATRVQASRSILEYALRLTEINDIIGYIEDADNVL